MSFLPNRVRFNAELSRFLCYTAITTVLAAEANLRPRTRAQLAACRLPKASGEVS